MTEVQTEAPSEVLVRARLKFTPTNRRGASIQLRNGCFLRPFRIQPTALSLIYLLAHCASVNAQMSTDQCASMIDGTMALVYQTRRVDNALVRMEMKKNAYRTAGDVAEASDDAETARQQALASLRTYEKALNELAQRLRSCAASADGASRSETSTDGKTVAPSR